LSFPSSGAEIHNIADVRDIERLFPLVQATQPAPFEADGDEDEVEIEARIEEVRKHIFWSQLRDSLDGGEAMKPGKRHWRYQTVEDLPGPAKVFHEKAG
jgi:RNA polymerase I-specific transcription initiation factor RRN7